MEGDTGMWGGDVNGAAKRLHNDFCVGFVASAVDTVVVDDDEEEGDAEEEEEG